MQPAWLAVFLVCLKSACPARILMMTLGGTKSHKVPFLALGQGLLSRGHQVTLVSAFPASPDSPLEEVTPLKLQEAVMSFSDMDVLGPKLRGERATSILDIITYCDKACRAFHAAPETSALLSRPVDLLVLDGAYPDCMLAFVHHFRVPFIYINTVAFYPVQFPLAGNPTMYSVTPFFDSTHSDRMSFLERSWNGICHFGNYIVVMIINKFYVEPTIRRHFGNDVPPNDVIGKNVSLILQNGHHTLTYPRPYLPGVIEIGCIHCKKAEPLPKDLEEFVSGGKKKGFIYVSFGTSPFLKSSQVPESLRLLFVNVFRELPYQVLWKYEEEGPMPDLPENVRLSQWLPQQDLLGHPKIKAFVNHGGLHSVFESAYNAVPMVCLPIYCDHPPNSRKAQDDGYAVVLDWQTLTKERLLAAINEVIYDKKYKENAKHRSELLRDQPEPPLDRALYWVDYVLRHRGAIHLQGAAKDLTFVQYFMLDTLAALVAIVYIIMLMLRTIWYRLFKRRKSKKQKQK